AALPDGHDPRRLGQVVIEVLEDVCEARPHEAAGPRQEGEVVQHLRVDPFPPGLRGGDVETGDKRDSDKEPVPADAHWPELNQEGVDRPLPSEHGPHPEKDKDRRSQGGGYEVPEQAGTGDGATLLRVVGRGKLAGDTGIIMQVWESHK